MPYLAFDTTSSLVSVAAVRPGGSPEVRATALRGSSELLLGLIDDALTALGAEPRELTGVVACAGPGSFTGIRVGLATAFGLHQALGVPATAVSALDLLAGWAHGAGHGPVVLSVVRAGRGHWFAQRFDEGGPLAPPHRTATADLAALEADIAVGFADRPPLDRWVTPGPLAPIALTPERLTELPWDPTTLVRPLYLQAPALSPPGPPKRVRPRRLPPA